MLALINKNLSRQQAYELVQRNAMTAWKGNKSFLTLLKSDAEVTARLPVDELEALFDEKYYLRYIDDIFKRLGLTEVQWQGKTTTQPTDLAPRSI
jgi:adenylosuccinate lyase